MKRKNGKQNNRLLLLGALAALIVASAALACAYVMQKPAIAEPLRIYLPARDSDEAVRDTLCTRLGDSYGSAVWRLWQWKGAKRGRGSYVVEPGTQAWRLARSLSHGAQTPVKVTFNSLRTLDDLAAHLAARLDFTADEFIAAADSVLLPRGYRSRAEYPAAFLPDTYEFYWNASPAHVATTFADVRDRFWTPERREKAAALGLTPVQVATLGSIVEEETAKTDERPMVARLYMNRLKKGMKLQADPTVKFAVGDFTLRRITAKHLDVNSPYNTYKVAGLPPGPIRITDRRTLDAVLSAPSHPYIYMCASLDRRGYHDFTETYDAHLANARRYHRWLTTHNIK